MANLGTACLGAFERAYALHSENVSNKTGDIKAVYEKLDLVTDLLVLFNDASKDPSQKLSLPSDHETLVKAREHFPNLFDNGASEWSPNAIEVMKQNLSHEAKKVSAPLQLHMMELNDSYQDIDKLIQILQDILRQLHEEGRHFVQGQTRNR